MTKQAVNIAQEALEFLYKVAAEYPVKSLAESRKLRVVFKCMEKPLQTYHAELKPIQEKYRVKEEIKEPSGATREIYKIPLASSDLYNQECMDAGNKRVTVDFDIESYGMIKYIFVAVFDRADVQSNGIAGELQMKYLDEIATALNIEDIEFKVPVRSAKDSGEGNAQDR